jgi:hypothetical protein
LRALGGFALEDAAGPFQDADHRLADAAAANLGRSSNEA